MEFSETQKTVLRIAADYASERGLNELTIGQLAQATGMSKAGLHGAFGSKTDLQISTIQFAAEIFTKEVILPSKDLESGAKRISAFFNAWISYVDRKVFPGGCFFARVSMEGDSLPEPVNLEIRKRFQSFRNFVSTELGRNSRSRKSDLSAKELADQLLSLVMGYNWAVHSLKNPEMGKHIRELLNERLKIL
ncbi:TetR family transcriptional regulator [Leptospira perolatii]|uniref:TetR family transcriptional regulator n=1 Tax=Leptospira perolatii TaxID=2023191 RepID=A0A2M9ZPS8_9LEPT|nr:TetR/AcrR family transcriptional regulator [Leptospira perolatii]PJZ69049.1 TetR family transcriptional regulator [Leptospira perolatii]PJZ74082.1 TetR family transcriptional regulator [Leptospira perolatii]